jgi:hypothetical protein
LIQVFLKRSCFCWHFFVPCLVTTFALEFKYAVIDDLNPRGAWSEGNSGKLGLNEYIQRQRQERWLDRNILAMTLCTFGLPAGFAGLVLAASGTTIRERLKKGD